MEVKKSSWREVWQCETCVLKYKEKPLKCLGKEGQCNSVNFLKKKVYCLDKILSFNAFMNMLIGGRRVGKTYSVAEYCVNQYLGSKSKFVWVRRYKTELKNALKAFTKLGYFFDTTGVYYKEVSEVQKKIKNKKNKKNETEIKEIITKKYIGLLITLSTASRIRGGEFNDFETMVIDEYGDESGTSLKKELTLVNSLITSILDEKNNTKVFVIANNVNRFLPIYKEIDIKWDQEYTYNWQRDAVTHIIDSKDRQWTGKASKWLQGSDYYEYSVYNKPMDNDVDLVEKYKLEFITPLFCFKITNLNTTLSILKINNFNFIISNCTNCQHTIYTIDNNASISFLKNLNKDLQILILEKYIKNQLKYTDPLFKKIIIVWVQRHLHLLL